MNAKKGDTVHVRGVVNRIQPILDGTAHWVSFGRGSPILVPYDDIVHVEPRPLAADDLVWREDGDQTRIGKIIATYNDHAWVLWSYHPVSVPIKELHRAQ